MYDMNKWKGEAKLESQADTYIERHFEEACQLLTNGNHILNEWRARKRSYISYTDTTIFDFQHYSRHDVSHSLNILESIELILGKERIEKLSAGDLWLILESAYFHDIGMSLNYEDLITLWQDKDFQTFIRVELAHAGADYQEARNWYLQMDNLLHERGKIEGIEEESEIEFGETWPVEAERRLLFLVADFVRRDHARRSRKFLDKFSCGQPTQIPPRMYQLVADISAAHGENFDFILSELYPEEKGFGIDKIHPRFAAALLRLGDLLDMDNNRFNIRAIEHFGKLPASSELHVKKHKSMSHILYDSRKIFAEASSSEIEVCQTIESWFAYIRQEVGNLIIHWNEMAPESLGGCIMQKAECNVYYLYTPGKRALFSSKSQKQFEVDKAKLTELLIGTNIYDTKMDFLREYIQNALDATKMQLWLWLKQEKNLPGELYAETKPGVFSPMDLSQKLCEDYAIEVNVQLDQLGQRVTLEVRDHGIGMEVGCINAISKIGAGWRERKEYNREVPQMPPWLRPTGGFGIGVQSAFMVTDQVEIITKSEAERDMHKLTLTSPRTTGRIMDESSFGNFQRGTSIKISFDYSYFEHWNHEYKGGEEKKEHGSAERKNTVQELIGEIEEKESGLCDFFSESVRLDYVERFLTKYFEEIVADSFIPVRLMIGKRKKVIKSPFIPQDDYWKYPDRYMEKSILDRRRECRCICDLEKKRLYIWDAQKSILTSIWEKEKLEAARHVVCFKNICVVRNTDYYLPYASDLNICIDFMGHRAEEALKVHRSSFNENFGLRSYLDASIQNYVEFLKLFWKDAQNMKKSSVKEEKEKAKRLEEMGKDIFRSFPKSWIYELYLPGTTSLRQTKRVGKKEVLPVLRLEITGNRNEEGKYEGVSITVREEELLLKEQKDIQQQIGQFFRREGNASVFLRRKSPQRAEHASAMINSNQIKDWLDRNNIPEDDVRWEENQNTWRILETLEGWDYCVLYEENLVRSFLEYPMLKKSSFRFDEKIAPEKDCEYVMLTWAEEGEEADEREFHVWAYNGGKTKRYIGGKSMAQYYPVLAVETLPYEITVNEQGPYVISPINEMVRGELSLRLQGENNMSLSEVPYEEYENIIYQKGDFESLVEWIYNNQVAKGKYSKDTIRKEYRRFMENIYQSQP